MGSRSELAGSAAVLAIAVLGIMQSLRFRLWTPEGPGEGMFPLLLSALLAVLSLCAVVAAIRSPRLLGQRESSPVLRAKLLGYVAALVVYAALFSVAGYVATTLVVFVTVLRLIEGLSWRLTLAVTLGTLILSHLLFERLLHVPLPHGVLP